MKHEHEHRHEHSHDEQFHEAHGHHIPFFLGARGRGGDGDKDGRGHGRHRGSGRGFGGFGFGPPGGGGFNPFGRGPRAKRGDVRAGILALLKDGPRNGYQIMQELEQRSQGTWRPSPGSVYPALQLLEDEGLIATEESAAGRAYALTAQGKTYVKEHADEVEAPWEALSSAAGDDFIEVMGLLRQLGAAAMQVVHSGHPAQIARARKLLGETRRGLYQLLAEEPVKDR